MNQSYNHKVLAPSQRENSKQPSNPCHGLSYIADQKGLYAVITAVSIFSLFAFTALGIEVGRWYIARAELSKAVDAAALIGAKNIGNPYLNPEDLMAEIGQANFTPGFLGTEGQANIVGTVLEEGRVSVVGSVNLFNTITTVLDGPASVGLGGSELVEEGTFDKVLIGSTSMAQQRDVEIMMVLDSSGSMNGAKMIALKSAAKSFVDFFEPTEEHDEMGLIRFASGVVVDVPRKPEFFLEMHSAIDNLLADGGTNTEDALFQVGNTGYGFTDQTVVSGDEKVQQFLIFFSDGNPTAFRGDFTRNGTDYDAVGYAADWNINLMDPNVQFQYLSPTQYETGDGLPSGSTACSGTNTKWHVLDDPTYGVNGYSAFGDVNYSDLLGTTDPEICNLSWSNGKSYVEAINFQMAIDHATVLKDDREIKIYTIGLGSDVNLLFLAALASGQAFEFHAPNETDLMALFQKVATNIKLRLLE